MNINELIAVYIVKEYPFLDKDILAPIVREALINPNSNPEVEHMIRKYEEEYAPFIFTPSGDIMPLSLYNSNDYLYIGSIRECINFFDNWLDSQQ